MDKTQSWPGGVPPAAVMAQIRSQAERRAAPAAPPEQTGDPGDCSECGLPQRDCRCAFDAGMVDVVKILGNLHSTELLDIADRLEAGEPLDLHDRVALYFLCTAASVAENTIRNANPDAYTHIGFRRKTHRYSQPEFVVRTARTLAAALWELGTP